MNEGQIVERFIDAFDGVGASLLFVLLEKEGCGNNAADTYARYG